MTPLSVYRQKARETLGGRIFSSEWIYALLVCLAITIIMGSAGTGVLAILTFIFTGPVYIGYCKYFIERARRNIGYDNLGIALEGFKGDLGNGIVSGILVTVFTFLWTLLFIIPGIIKSYSYSMTYYVLCDHPGYTAKEAITESRKLMQGNKMRLFCLQLSFIGWFIVGLLCLGIGLLWVMPYYKAAEAEFYQDLVKFSPSKIDEPNENIFEENSDIFNN